MTPNAKKELLLLAKLMEAERTLTKRIQEIRNRRDQRKWFSSERGENCLIVNVSLVDVLAIDPEAKQEWKTFPCDDGSVKGYFVYGPVHLGELRKGFHAWAKHETKSVVISEAAAVKTDASCAQVAEEEAEEYGGEDEAAGFEPGTLASDRRLARRGLSVVRFSSGAVMTVNSKGRCEDAPCCGCCT